MRILLVVAVLVVAGCATPSGPDAKDSWSPFVESGQTPYGFLGVQHGEFGSDLRYAGIDRAGNVLTVSFEVKREADAWHLEFASSRLEPWRPILEHLFANGTIDGDTDHPHSVRILDVRSIRLPQPDRDAVIARLDGDLARAKEPQPFPIADCGYTVMRAGARAVTLNCGQGDAGWSDAYKELQQLWAKAYPE